MTSQLPTIERASSRTPAKLHVKYNQNEPRYDVELVSSDGIGFRVEGRMLRGLSESFNGDLHALMNGTFTVENQEGRIIIRLSNEAYESSDIIQAILDIFAQPKGKNILPSLDRPGDAVKLHNIMSFLRKWDCPVAEQLIMSHIGNTVQRRDVVDSPGRLLALAFEYEDVELSHTIIASTGHILTPHDAANIHIKPHQRAKPFTSHLDPRGMSLETKASLRYVYFCALVQAMPLQQYDSLTTAGRRAYWRDVADTFRIEIKIVLEASPFVFGTSSLDTGTAP